MDFSCIFFINSVLLGAGLAMDAFSVSMANGLNESAMKTKRMCLIAGVFAFFQFIMPLAGWFCVYTIVEYFNKFSRFIPWIALFLLLYIGGKMILESFHPDKDAAEAPQMILTFPVLLIQGVATSIDALSVGFTIADYGLLTALTASLIIAAVTFIICMSGLVIGKKAASHLSSKATLVGGLILVGIGIEIFIRGIISR